MQGSARFLVLHHFGNVASVVDVLYLNKIRPPGLSSKTEHTPDYSRTLKKKYKGNKWYICLCGLAKPSSMWRVSRDTIIMEYKRAIKTPNHIFQYKNYIEHSPRYLWNHTLIKRTLSLMRISYPLMPSMLSLLDLQSGLYGFSILNPSLICGTTALIMELCHAENMFDTRVRMCFYRCDHVRAT